MAWFSEDGIPTEEVLWCCNSCRYWQYQHHFSVLHANILLDCGEDDCYISKLRRFDEDFPEECTAKISQSMRRSPSKWRRIRPATLEKLVAEMFRRNYAESEVMHVGRPDDEGVDVIFVDGEKKQWLIQVKRRETPDAAEGVSTIRNLLGAMYLKECLRGIVVSTADHFSYRAYDAVGRAAELGSTVRLIDKGTLDRMLEPLLPDSPWLEFIKEKYSQYYERFSELLSRNDEYPRIIENKDLELRRMPLE